MKLIGLRHCVLLVVIMGSSACVIQPQPIQADQRYQDCSQRFQAFSTAVAQAEVGDAQSARMRGFPYLRVNRFWSLFAQEGVPTKSRQYWLAQLRQLDREGRAIEWANMGAVARNALDGRAGPIVLEECARYMLVQDERYRSAELDMAAQVPSAYSTTGQVLGLYPLTQFPLGGGVKDWEAEVLQRFKQPLPVQSRQQYRPAEADAQQLNAAQLKAILTRATNNELSVPQPNAEDLQALLQHYAPNYAIPAERDYDRPGVPALPAVLGNRPEFAVNRPEVFTLASHTRFGDQNLLQLVYVLWFSERPAESELDILAGGLDGLVWRVTLDEDGQPLLYDSIHPCGCYHQFYPTARLRDRKLALAPQIAPALQDNERLQIVLTSKTHFVERLQVAKHQTSEAQAYQLRSYDVLRQLPYADGTRSLFADDGMVLGTERLERFAFWPSGVRNAGAMRQWGHHATAFDGERHFDDARLFETLFERALP